MSLVTDPKARLIAIGVAGVVAGVIIGAVSRRSGNAADDALPPRQTITVTERPSATAPVERKSVPPKAAVASAVGASGAPSGGAGAPAAPSEAAALPAMPDEESIADDDAPLHPSAAPSGEAPTLEVAPEVQKGLSPALRAAVEADKWFKALRVALHDALGTGALATQGGLTPAGRRIMERVRRLDADAVSSLGYGVEALEQRLLTWSPAEADVASLEAQLGRALVRLVFDYRVLRTTGPFRLVGETDVGKDTALQREARDLALAFVRAADDVAGDVILDPPHPSWAPLKAAFARYKDLVAKGGCKPLVGARGLKMGAKGDGVKRLQERLACEGYYTGEIDGDFDEDLRLAVSQFQRHHELPDEGLVLAETFVSINVPMKRRLEQLDVGLKRLRETRIRELGPRYLKVNIPAYELQAIEDGKIVKRVRVIVGTNRLDDDKVSLVQGHINRTKLFVSRLYEVLINPTWILPDRVTHGELVTKVSDDPEYLKKLGIGKRTLPDGRQVLIQGQGRDNVLGKVKFLLEKTNAIYLHDTDKPWLFKEERRAFSHGCMRVHEAIGFARWLLLRDGYPPDEVEKTVALVKMQKGMPLRKPWAFLTEYITVDASDEGLPKFLTDVYGYDKAYAEGKLPPFTQTRWGSKLLRPRWVPEASNELIDEWRKSGQRAPNDPKWRPGAAPIDPDDIPAGAAPFPEDKKPAKPAVKPAGKPAKPSPGRPRPRAR
jgi:peptidoglycan hydrolase-like protein with peptidoglycan-binding domain